MSVNFSIFDKVFPSPLARMIGGVLGFVILLLQAYHLAPVQAGKQLIAVSIFNQEQPIPWVLVFLFGFICVMASLLVVLRMNTNHRFVEGKSFPLAIFLIIALSSYPAVLLQPEMLFVSFLGVVIVYLLLNIYNQHSIAGIILKASFLCSIATLIYAPSIIFLLIILIGVTLFRPFNIRNTLLICVGFMLFYIYLFGLSYIFDWKLSLPLEVNFDFYRTLELLLTSSRIGVWFVFLLAILTISSVYTYRQRLIVRQRNQLSLLLAAFLLCFIVGVLFNLTGSFVFLFAILGLFFLFFYNNLNKKWLIEVPLIGLFIYNSLVSIFI